MNPTQTNDFTPQNMTGKRVLITGGTDGIGRAIACLLLARGAQVFAFGRDEAQTQIVREQDGIEAMTADQSSLEEVRRVFSEAEAKLGGIDILVNCVGVKAASILTESPEHVAYAVATNLTGFMHCTREAIERMKTNDGELRGHIVMIGSIDTEQRDTNSDIHSATKAGVQAFAASLRKTLVHPDYAIKGIKVSLIEPGRTRSGMIAPPDADAQIERGELLEAEDVARAVLYVLSQPARCDVVNVQVRPHLQMI